MSEKKKPVPKKGRPEKYKKSTLAINGSFDEAVKVFFKKVDKAKSK